MHFALRSKQCVRSKTSCRKMTSLGVKSPLSLRMLMHSNADVASLNDVNSGFNAEKFKQYSLFFCFSNYNFKSTLLAIKIIAQHFKFFNMLLIQ